MAHNHVHHHQKNLFWAIVMNLLLTVAQIVGGVLSGSLSLMADALHNFSDAGSLIVAYVAQKISGRPGSGVMTFGYGRAQILGALINSVTLVIVGFYLLFECWQRYSQPQLIEGWIVIGVAGGALFVDLVTVALTHKGAKDNINMRAAFIHNLSDAMASVVVIFSGIMILLFEVYWLDTLATLLISIFILYHSVGLIKSTIRTLMQGVPEDLSASEIQSEVLAIDGVEGLHHLHIWSIHEKFRSLEAHIVVDGKTTMAQVEPIKMRVRQLLKEKYKITHATLEIESDQATCFEESKHCTPKVE